MGKAEERREGDVGGRRRGERGCGEGGEEERGGRN